jgi:hypothetical protein
LREFVPDSVAQYPIPWTGAPKEGTYRLVGQIRPAGTPVIKIDARLKVNGRTVASARRSTAGRTSPPAANSGISLVVWLAMGAVTTVAVMFAFAFVRMRRRLLAATAHDQKRPS